MAEGLRELDTGWCGGKKRNRFVMQTLLGSSPGMDTYQLTDARQVIKSP